MGYALNCFSGEVELTGVVVSAYNNEEGENLFETRFYPDRNLDYSYDTEIKSLPQNEWLEVFYLAPNAKKLQEAIFGYIHSSQLKVSCE